MADGTWYESPLTCIPLYYRQCYTKMHARWNLVQKSFNMYYLVLQAMLHGEACQMELGTKVLEHVLPCITGNATRRSMPDGTWYERPLTCITLYYRQCYTEMHARWNLLRKAFNMYYLVLQAMLHGEACQIELGTKVF